MQLLIKFCIVAYEKGPNDLDGRGALSADSSLYSFTRHFDGALNAIAANPDKIITIDGGPHTLWWCVLFNIVPVFSCVGVTMPSFLALFQAYAEPGRNFPPRRNSSRPNDSRNATARQIFDNHQ